MDRRFLTVLGVSLLFALVVSAVFYQVSSRAGGPRRPKNLETTDVVVAARPLPVGVSVKPDDVKITRVPAEAFPKGAFAKVEEVIDRSVVSNILMEEPILEGRLAQRGSGLGLAPVIPVGMRAVSVRVNEVVGVAGFVLPGMHVDVLVTGRPPEGGQTTITTTVLQNITVLSAGQTIQSDPAGQAINAPVVTLLVTPQQAEVLTLAGNETKIQLVLRNSADDNIAETTGKQIQELYRRAGYVPPDADAARARRVRERPPAPVVAPPVEVKLAAPPAPELEQVVIIRGTKRTVEAVGEAAALASKQ